MKTEEDLWEIVGNKLDQMYPPTNLYEDTDEADALMDARIKAGVKLLIEEKKKAGMAIARYDNATKKAYVEYADGHREYVNI